jgi:hydrogenase expression/formation protein HypE
MRRIRFIDAFSAGSRQDSRPVVHVLRDRTRSGVTSVLIEIAQTAKVGLLLDPLYAANEGKLLVIIAIENVDLALKVLSSHSLGPTSWSTLLGF